MIVFPNAKINLGLKVSANRNDGYHSIESVFYPIPLCDILEVNKSDELHFSYSGIPIEKENLIRKTFFTMQKAFDIGNVNIHLHKQIPIGAGLGGGSSDASFLLNCLNQIFSLNLTNEQLLECALSFGSDCPFFINNKASLVRGRGEILESSPIDLKGKFIKIIYPDIFISTQEAFSHYSEKKDAIVPENIELYNVFEEWARSTYPELDLVKNQLQNEGAYLISMSGTGSSFFGLFHEKPKKSKAFASEWIFELE